MDEAASPKPAEFRQVMVGLGLAMLLSALDQTIVVTAMPTIGQELGDPQESPFNRHVLFGRRYGCDAALWKICRCLWSSSRFSGRIDYFYLWLCCLRLGLDNGFISRRSISARIRRWGSYFLSSNSDCLIW